MDTESKNCTTKRKLNIGTPDELIKKPYLNEFEVSTLTGIALSTLRNSRFLRRGFPYLVVGKRMIRYKTTDILAGMEARRISFDEAGR